MKEILSKEENENVMWPKINITNDLRRQAVGREDCTFSQNRFHRTGDNEIVEKLYFPAL